MTSAAGDLVPVHRDSTDLVLRPGQDDPFGALEPGRSVGVPEHLRPDLTLDLTRTRLYVQGRVVLGSRKSAGFPCALFQFGRQTLGLGG